MFTVGEGYRRKELHREFGGQQVGRISTPANDNLIFLFAGDPVGKPDYLSGWTSYGVFRFVGEGRYGHMTFTRGNRALRQHTAEGKHVHLFTRPDAATADHVRYEGEMIYRAHFYKEGADLRQNPRRMIVFLLKNADI